MLDHLLAQLALRAKLLTVSGLPTARAWENIAFTPEIGVPYVEEEYVPATQNLRGLVKGGTVETTGLYIVRWYGVANTGLSAIRNGVNALLTVFAPGTAISLSNGQTLYVRGDVAPSPSQLTNDGDGRAVVTISIPFRAYTITPA